MMLSFNKQHKKIPAKTRTSYFLFLNDCLFE
jgi:hypothetical protein